MWLTFVLAHFCWHNQSLISLIGLVWCVVWMHFRNLWFVCSVLWLLVLQFPIHSVFSSDLMQYNKFYVYRSESPIALFLFAQHFQLWLSLLLHQFVSFDLLHSDFISFSCSFLFPLFIHNPHRTLAARKFAMQYICFNDLSMPIALKHLHLILFDFLQRMRKKLFANNLNNRSSAWYPSVSCF